MKIQRSHGTSGNIPVDNMQKKEMDKTIQKINRVELPVTHLSRDVRLLKEAKGLSHKIKNDWNNLAPHVLAEKIVDLEAKVERLDGKSSAVKKIKEAAQNYAFNFIFPGAKELDISRDPTFAKNIDQIAKAILKNQSFEPLQGLNQVQYREIMRYAGGLNMSPEGMSYAMAEYLDALRYQADVAKAFFFGKLAEGMKGLLALPEDVRLRVDQLIWEAAGGVSLDPTEKESQGVIAAAIMHSVEERMGMHSED